MLYIHGGTLPEPLVCVCVCVREGCGCGAGTLCTTLHSVRASNVACAGPNVRPERLVQPQCAPNLQRCTLLALAHSGCAHPVVSTPPVRPQCRTSSSVTLRNSLCQVIRVYSTACFARTAGSGVVLLGGTMGAAFLHSTVRTHDLSAAQSQ
jgi:hypothetical protein